MLPNNPFNPIAAKTRLRVNVAFGVIMSVLPDVMARNLAVVFCGSAVGSASARRGAYYAGPGNAFWPTLFEVGLTPRLLKPSEYRQVLDYGLGLTDLAKHVSGSDDTLSEGDFDRKGLRTKIERYEPRILAFTSKRAAEEYLFEHALAHLIDSELDLSAFEARFRNDTTGAAAYPPSVLLKIVLLAYSRGIMSSRAIEAACRQNVLFMAISGDTQPHFTTIAQFISTSAPAITQTFAQVLMVCDRAGLIQNPRASCESLKQVQLIRMPC